MIRNIRAKFDIHNLLQSSDNRQNSDGGISNFEISGQSFIKENCHNSRTSDDTDMKLGPKVKLDKRKKTTAKHFDDHVRLVNRNVSNRNQFLFVTTDA